MKYLKKYFQFCESKQCESKNNVYALLLIEKFLGFGIYKSGHSSLGHRKALLNPALTEK